MIARLRSALAARLRAVPEADLEPIPFTITDAGWRALREGR